MKVMYLALALLATSTWLACGSNSDVREVPKVESEDDKTIYAIGLIFASQGLKGLFTKAEVDAMHGGLVDGMAGNEPAVKLEEYGPKMQAVVEERKADSTRVGQGEDMENICYALGLAIAMNLKSAMIEPEEIGLVHMGLTDGILGNEAVVQVEEYGPKVQSLVMQRVKNKGQAFVQKAAAEDGAVQTASGLVYQEIKAGTGAQPKATDNVKVHYHGTLTDGTVFDSSVERNEPIDFDVKGVIAGWTEGLQLMKVGGKARLVISSDLAYGDGGRPPSIQGGATLVFEVELLGIN